MASESSEEEGDAQDEIHDGALSGGGGGDEVMMSQERMRDLEDKEALLERAAELGQQMAAQNTALEEELAEVKRREKQAQEARKDMEEQLEEAQYGRDEALDQKEAYKQAAEQAATAQHTQPIMSGDDTSTPPEGIPHGRSNVTEEVAAKRERGPGGPGPPIWQVA